MGYHTDVTFEAAGETVSLGMYLVALERPAPFVAECKAALENHEVIDVDNFMSPLPNSNDVFVRIPEMDVEVAVIEEPHSMISVQEVISQDHVSSDMPALPMTNIDAFSHRSWLNDDQDVDVSLSPLLQLDEARASTSQQEASAVLPTVEELVSPSTRDEMELQTAAEVTVPQVETLIASMTELEPSTVTAAVVDEHVPSPLVDTVPVADAHVAAPLIAPATGDVASMSDAALSTSDRFVSDAAPAAAQESQPSTLTHVGVRAAAAVALVLGVALLLTWGFCAAPAGVAATTLLATDAVNGAPLLPEVPNTPRAASIAVAASTPMAMAAPSTPVHAPVVATMSLPTEFPPRTVIPAAALTATAAAAAAAAGPSQPGTTMSVLRFAASPRRGPAAGETDFGLFDATSLRITRDVRCADAFTCCFL
jgi:hypothetical protein